MALPPPGVTRFRPQSLAARMPSDAIPRPSIDWGLSSRLPRCQMFDGRQSRLTPKWASHGETHDETTDEGSALTQK